MTLSDTVTSAGDPLNELIGRMHWTVTSFDRVVLASGERRRFEGSDPTFHYIQHGTATIVVGPDEHTVTTSDFVLLPRGGAHELRATDDVRLFSGEMPLESAVGSPMDRHLPGLLVACGLSVREPIVASLLLAMEVEHAAGRVGAASLVSRLANVVATAAIRTWVEKGCGEGTNDWLVSLRDPNISLALEAIHGDPGSPWTVASLARVARSSRSIFSERFHATVGDPPLRYLSRVRMERAMQLMSRDGLSVAQTAATLGYGSDVAFSRAFRRFVGESPSAWRLAQAARVA
jgi:AraC-like DNA-binding protein